METFAALWQFHEIIKIICFLAAACPIFFEVVENRLTLMELTRLLAVFLFHKLLPTCLVHALQFPIFRLKQLFLCPLLHLLLLFLLLLYF